MTQEGNRMTMRIRITWGTGQVTGILQDTPTAQKVWNALPWVSEARTWGNEVYFELPVRADLEPDAQDVVEPGTIGYWVQGASLVLPFGSTPISEGRECRLITRVNVLGSIEGDLSPLTRIYEGEQIRAEQA